MDWAVQVAALAAARARYDEARTVADDQNEQLARNERLNTLGGTAAISQDTLLQVNVRVGEFAPAQILTTPLVVMGQLAPLHLRTDIDENDVPRFRPEAEAWASPRGAAERRVKLSLVRVEPYVVPKTSLTRAGTERVDTRVLRVVYAFDPKLMPSFPGQQMDVFVGP